MDSDRFDAISRTIAAVNRRTALAGLLGGALTHLSRAGVEADVAASGRCKRRCDQCEKCKKGRCRSKRNGTRCGQFQVCRHGRCQQQTCGDGGPCLVFVTSSTHTGNLMTGLPGADAICQQRADEAGLPGRYVAWLSDSADSPSTHFTNTVKTGPYFLPVGIKIADNWADLTNGDIAVPINLTETGQQVPNGSLAWTNTSPDGRVIDNTQATTCAGWSSASLEFSGRFGRTNETGQGWTSNMGLSCASALRLYCFQQG